MKKIILTLTTFLFCVSFLPAQVVLYGLTSGGGSGGGTIVKFQPASNTLEAVYAFNTNSGIVPGGRLFQASDNKLYGMTIYGGASGYGTIFSYDPVSNVFTKLYDFDGTNGAEPNGSLIQAADGKLYGMTTFGGINNYGTVFSYDPVTAKFAKLHDFELHKGTLPYGSLTQYTDGKLYGLTSSGGEAFAPGDGIAFSFNPIDSTFEKVYQFGGYTFPEGSFTLASNGLLYSAITNGGYGTCSSREGDGSLFGFLPGSSYSIESQFVDAGMNLKNPSGDLIEASNGKLYGVTERGGINYSCGFGGEIYSYDTTTKKLVDEHNFTYEDGEPSGSMIQASDGKLYGMTNRGGSSNIGIIFSFDPSSSNFTKLQDYNGSNGASPSSRSGFIELKSCSAPIVKTDSITNACAGSSVTLHTSGGQTYNWTGPGGFTSSAQNPVIDSVTASASGWYKVTVSNGKGCTATDSTLVNVNPLPMVSIPNTSALPIGVDPNTVYTGFSPANYITLTASVKNKQGNLTYAWSNGGQSASIRVNPTVTTTYSVTVTDTFGCSQSAIKTVKVQDVRCGNKLNKVEVCRAKGKQGKVKEDCADPFTAFIELLFGAHLGSCDNNNLRIGITDKTEDDQKSQLRMKVSPNPSSNYFKIEVKGNDTKNNIYVRVLDKVGRLLEVMSVKDSQTLTIGSSYSHGMYFVEAIQGSERVTLKVIKL